MAKSPTAPRNLIQDVTFLWEGKDKRGRRITGKTLARDDKALRVTLRTQGIAPLHVRKQSTHGRRGKVTPEDIVEKLNEKALDVYVFLKEVFE